MYLEDAGGHPEEEPAYRPARRNSKQDDLIPLGLAENYQAKGPSRQASRESVATLDATMDVYVQKQVILSVEEELFKAASGGEKGAVRRDDGLLKVADQLQAPLVAPISPGIERVLPIDGRPINFGVVVPGVYRSSYPKPEDFGFIRNLGLKSIV